MTVNSTQTRTRSKARTGRSPKTPATPAASARRARPGRVSATPLRPAPVAGSPIAGSRPKPSASAAEVVRAYLKVQVAKLRSLEPEVRADEFDSVHQMRVATRRLRATFRSFGPVIPRSATGKVAAELKWLGGLLGEARDGEVL
ncbi:MAG TPA: CHAD domain-containing protein, partial [Nocardioidaceae bacterium]|nr:CHAD domain-containing protein [Nocardioidaceae bacterium]